MQAQLTGPHQPYPDGELDHYLLLPGKETTSFLLSPYEMAGWGLCGFPVDVWLE